MNGRSAGSPTLAQNSSRVVLAVRGEPQIVGRGAGDYHLLGLQAVHLDRFLLLCFVPHIHAVGRHPHQPLVGQVVPTVYAQPGAHAPRAGALDIVDLV